MIRVMFSRLTELVRALRHFLFRITRPFLTTHAITLYQLNYANQLAGRGEHDEAIAILDGLIDLNPGFPPLYAVRGSLYALQLRHDKTLADYNEAIKLGEFDVDCYVARGQVWAGLGEYERAVDDFNTAIEMEPLAEAYSARGDAFMAIGKYIAAIDDYERVIKRRPDASAYEARGNAYFYLNLFDDALNDFNTATQLDPNMVTSYGIYAMLGNIHLRQGDHGAAAEDFTRVIKLMADIVDEDSLNFINSDFKSHLYETAVRAVGTAYCGRGMARSRTGDVAAAHSDFSSAIRIMPEQASFYLARASAYAERGEHSEAMQDLEVAARLDGQSAETHCMMAWVHFCGEEFDEVLQDCRITIDLNPHWSVAYFIRGLAYMRLGDCRNAIDDFGKAIELGPEKPLEWHGPWYARPDMSVSLNLDRPAAYAHRGLAYLLLGDEAKGREDIVEATELGYAQSEIQDEAAALLSDEEERRTVREFVRRAVDDARVKREDRLWQTGSMTPNPGRYAEPDGTSENSSSRELMALSKEAYTGLFQRLGFYDIKVGRTLKHPEPIPSIYFNSRYGVVYFVAYLKDRERFRPGLWRLVRPRRSKEDRNNLITIVPRAGREWDAFEQIITGDAVSEGSLAQLQESTIRVMVNDYRERKPKDTVNGGPVSGMIHRGTCQHVPKDPGQWWIRFNSLEAAQAAFGVHAATCTACLAGEGKHLDRTRRA